MSVAARASARVIGGGNGLSDPDRGEERFQGQPGIGLRAARGSSGGASDRSRNVRTPVAKSKPPSSPRTRSVEPVKPSSAGAIQLCTNEARKPSAHSSSTE